MPGEKWDPMNDHTAVKLKRTMAAGNYWEIHDVEQTKKMTPPITCHIIFCQHVCELFFGVNKFDYGVLQFNPIKQPIQRNSLGSGHVSHRRTFFFFKKKKKKVQRYKVSAMIRDAKKSRGTSHSDITQTKKRKCNERRSLKGRLKRNLAGHTIDPRTHWIQRPPGPPATVSLGWLLASLSGANPDKYWASPPRPRWTAPGEVCLIVKLLPLMIMLLTASLSSKMYN